MQVKREGAEPAWLEQTAEVVPRSVTRVIVPWRVPADALPRKATFTLHVRDAQGKDLALDRRSALGLLPKEAEVSVEAAPPPVIARLRAERAKLVGVRAELGAGDVDGWLGFLAAKWRLERAEDHAVMGRHAEAKALLEAALARP